MEKQVVMIREDGLTFEDFEQVVFHRATVVLSDECKARVLSCRAFLERVLAEKRTVYGVNTGFGKLSTVILQEDETEALQLNLIRSHACAVGQPYSEEVVRGMMLMRIVSLTRGHSGVRPVVIDALVECLNRGVHPIIPQQGSLGASGDLAPLAHLALVLLGEGEATYEGVRMSGAEALARAGVEKIVLVAKEGLALINGTQAMLAVGMVAYRMALHAMTAANAAAAMTMESLYAILDPFSEDIQNVRPYPEQKEVAQDIRTYLEGSELIQKPNAHKVQDAYAIRCIPQVHGASLRALRHVGETLHIEMSAATDNPLLFPDADQVYSGGNFHGQPIALAMDYLKIALAEIANISERRMERLVNPHLNEGLPPFLTADAGRSSGMMILQYVAASLVSENKVLAHPASVDSIPSSGNQEDHVSMGTTAARHAKDVAQNVLQVLAIELIGAAQALEFRNVDKASKTVQDIYEFVRQYVAPYRDDRSYSAEMEALASALASGELSQLLAAK